jgi:hypothetical protein
MPEPGGTISMFWNAFAPHCNDSNIPKFMAQLQIIYPTIQSVKKE